jgi:hypothetical protein
LGEIIELGAAFARTIFRQRGGEVGGVLREDEKLGVAVEQSDHQRRSGFRLPRDETGPLIEGQLFGRHINLTVVLQCGNLDRKRQSPQQM